MSLRLKALIAQSASLLLVSTEISCDHPHKETFYCPKDSRVILIYETSLSTDREYKLTFIVIFCLA